MQNYSKLVYLPIRIALISLGLQIGFYLLNRFVFYPDIFSNLKDYSYSSANQDLDKLRNNWIDLKTQKLPYEAAKGKFDKLRHKMDALGGIDTFQSTVGFPYIYLLFFLSFPFMFIIADSSLGNQIVDFGNWIETLVPPFQRVPTFSNYLRTGLISFAGLLFVGYGLLWIISLIKKSKNTPK